MRISKKTQYALRGILELALRNTGQPVKTHDIANAQGISPRFLEVILNELKHGGFVESRRGNEGGYMLARNAKNLTVGEIIEYVEGRISVAPDESEKANRNVAFAGDDAFKQLWQKVNSAVSAVCDGTTFAKLVELERAKREASVPNYFI